MFAFAAYGVEALAGSRFPNAPRIVLGALAISGLAMTIHCYSLEGLFLAPIQAGIGEDAVTARRPARRRVEVRRVTRINASLDTT